MIVYKDRNGNIIPQGVAFELEDYKFPNNWLDLTTEEEKAAWGITTEVVPDPEPVVEVPSQVTRAQAKIALYRAGLLTKVTAMISGMGGETEIWFNEAAAWERNNHYVLALGSALELSAEQIDGLFIEAGKV